MINKSIRQVSESVSGNLDFYTVYTTFDFTPTGEYTDQSQRLFDVINTTIGFRTQIIINSEPDSVTDLAVAGAPTLTGAGFMWNFATEHSEAFAIHHNAAVVDEIGILKAMFDEMEVNGFTVEYGINIEIVRVDSI